MNRVANARRQILEIYREVNPENLSRITSAIDERVKAGTADAKYMEKVLRKVSK